MPLEELPDPADCSNMLTKHACYTCFDHAFLATCWLLQVTDAMTEARDNLKYLHALDATWEPLYQHASLAAVHNCLPAVLANIYSMHTVSRSAFCSVVSGTVLRRVIVNSTPEDLVAETAPVLRTLFGPL